MTRINLSSITKIVGEKVAKLYLKAIVKIGLNNITQFC